MGIARQFFKKILDLDEQSDEKVVGWGTAHQIIPKKQKFLALYEQSGENKD